MAVYVQERASGKVHRIRIEAGEAVVVCRCELPEEHQTIDEQEFLILARLGQDNLCGPCFAPVAEA